MAGAPAPCLVCSTVSDAIMGAEAPAAAVAYLWGDQSSSVCAACVQVQMLTCLVQTALDDASKPETCCSNYVLIL